MSDPTTRLNAALEGRYRIERELGEGGMAAAPPHPSPLHSGEAGGFVYCVRPYHTDPHRDVSLEVRGGRRCREAAIGGLPHFDRPPFGP